jgi:hypothetical protein
LRARRQPPGGWKRAEKSEHIGARALPRHGQLSDFGKELARSLFDDRHHMAQTIPRADGNGTYDEHEHAGARLTCHEQEIARFVAMHLQKFHIVRLIAWRCPYHPSYARPESDEQNEKEDRD